MGYRVYNFDEGLDTYTRQTYKYETMEERLGKNGQDYTEFLRKQYYKKWNYSWNTPILYVYVQRKGWDQLWFYRVFQLGVYDVLFEF